MINHKESSAEGHATAEHAPSASTTPSGRGLALALVVLGVFLMTSITGLALWFWPNTLTIPISIGIIMRSLHGHFAAAIILVVPLAILRAVLFRKESGERAVRIVEAAAFVALVIALSVPTSLLPREQIGGWALSLWPLPETPPPSEPYSARELLTAGKLNESVRRMFFVVHGVMVPLALIGVGAAFVHRRRRAMNERHGSTR